MNHILAAQNPNPHNNYFKNNKIRTCNAFEKINLTRRIIRLSLNIMSNTLYTFLRAIQKEHLLLEDNLFSAGKIFLHKADFWS